ncbi:NAD(P)H-hydrate dehydratase [Lysobacter fragariae]
MLTDSILLDGAALRRIEAGAAQALGDDFELMRRAGQAAWRELLKRWPQAQRVVVACGPGNNGGDGYVLARHALEAGRDVVVVHLPGQAPRSSMAERAQAQYRAPGGRVDEFIGTLPTADVIVDAIFGIGLTRAPDPQCTSLIRAINTAAVPVLALDVPSGIDSDRGSAPGAAVVATVTIEFIAHKCGLVTGDALDHLGASVLATLDAPVIGDDVIVAAERIAPRDLPRWLKPRARNSHKGTHGRVLCIGGDHGGGGAIMLCAEAALRCGAGLVDVATRELHVPALLARLPEALAHVPTHASQFSASLERADVIAIGPGLGLGEWGKPLLQQAIATRKPLVLDADALNLIAAGDVDVPVDAIMTPHPGEAARLLGIPTREIQRDRFAAANALRERYGCVVVLKGAGSVIAARNQLPRVVHAGNPGMAVGGMGDVLTGTIAALRAQGLDAFDAASAGALLHAAAGDAAATLGERGMIASDLMPWLRTTANPGISI